MGLLVGLWALASLSADPGAEAEDYIVGPRDKIYVAVWGEKDMEQIVDVSSQGTIPFFFVGEVKVAGLSVNQVREKLTALLHEGYFKNPIVIVKIEEYHSKEVQIQGAVTKPGTYILETNFITLLKLISMAGGASENRGNYAYVTRGEAGISAELKPAAAPEPRPGETAAPTLAGATIEPAPAFGWPVSAGDTAKPPTPPAAAPAPTPAPPKAAAQEVVDLRMLLEKGDPSQDIRIYPGDFVLVGSIKIENPASNYVFVEGAVRNPQQLEYLQGMTVLQAVIQAGGVTDVGSPNRTVITRLGPDGNPQTIRVPLKDIQRGKKPDVPLQPGDRINVPESIF